MWAGRCRLVGYRRAAVSIGHVESADDECADDAYGKRPRCLYDTSLCSSITVSYKNNGEPKYVIYSSSYAPDHVLMCMLSSKTTGQYQFVKGNINETAGDLPNVSVWTQSGKGHTLSRAEYKA